MTTACVFEGCDKPIYNKTLVLCHAHYAQQRRGEELRPLRKRAKTSARTETPCMFENCDKFQYSKGLCRGHYGQQQRGSELKPLQGSPDWVSAVVKPERKDPEVKGVCSFEGCYKTRTGNKVVCSGHYQQERKGLPLTPLKYRPTKEEMNEGY